MNLGEASKTDPNGCTAHALEDLSQVPGHGLGDRGGRSDLTWTQHKGYSTVQHYVPS